MAAHSSILAWTIPWQRSPRGYSPRGRKESGTTEGQHARSYLQVARLKLHKGLPSHLEKCPLCALKAASANSLGSEDIISHWPKAAAGTAGSRCWPAWPPTPPVPAWLHGQCPADSDKGQLTFPRFTS